MQKLIRILSRQESVVPLRQHPVFAQAQLVHLRIGDLNAGGIILGDQTACDAEPCGGRSFTDELGDQWVSLERDASPVFADLAEQAMFDGIVTDGDRQLPGVHQLLLQRPLPGPALITIAATAIGENEQMRMRAVEPLSLLTPPVADRLDGKGRGVVRSAHTDRAAIGLQVVDAVGDGHAECLGAEVVIVDLHRLSAPAAARILEATDEFLLFGVDADDRLTATDKTLTLSSDMPELPIALRARGSRQLFAVAA